MPDYHRMFPSHRLAWSGQCYGKLVWQGEYHKEYKDWHEEKHITANQINLINFNRAGVDSLGSLELSEKPGEHLWQPHCRGICSGDHLGRNYPCSLSCGDPVINWVKDIFAVESSHASPSLSPTGASHSQCLESSLLVLDFSSFWWWYPGPKTLAFLMRWKFFVTLK